MKSEANIGGRETFFNQQGGSKSSSTGLTGTRVKPCRLSKRGGVVKRGRGHRRDRQRHSFT